VITTSPPESAHLVGLALGLWGFALCRDCGVTGFWPMLARSFALVRGAGTYTLGQHPWQLVVAQFMLPGLALFGGAKLLLVNLRRDLRVALARRQRNHTIVCGLGDTGRQIVENMRASGRDVVAGMVGKAGPQHALDGGMQRVADKVFLLTPRNVEVSAEERARLLERGGFFNQA